MNKNRNIALLTEIAVWLEAGGHDRGLQFNMNWPLKTTEELYRDRIYDAHETYALYETAKSHHCETVGCIMGAAVQFSGLKSRLALSDIAIDLLKIGRATAMELFYADRAKQKGVFSSYFDIDAAWAGRCVRKLIETGYVDWAGTK